MMNNFQRGKIQGIALVRDSEGNPRFDDWHNIDPRFFTAKKHNGDPLLTQADRQFIKSKQEEANHVS